jgi:hypothetical protein
MPALSAGIFSGGGCDQSTTPTIDTAMTTILISMIDPMTSETAPSFPE